MEYCHKIDKSLTERHNIVNLLESLKKEDITMEEMEKVGAMLQKAGRRALLPLIRRLWREENGDHISRYVYLLDFFENDAWIDQIIRIALKRNDLEEDGKVALLAVLEDYGIDIGSPPFSRLLEEINGPPESALPRLLDKGEAGTICFLEDFLGYARDTQLVVVRSLAKVKDSRVISLLEILLGFDDREIVMEAILTLGKIRDRSAATLLSRFDGQGNSEYLKLAERSLLRLSFLGILPEQRPANLCIRSNYESSISSIDGMGNRTLWFSRREADGRRDVLVMQLHERKGMVDALGYGDISCEKYEKLFNEVVGEEALVEIDPDYATLIVRDALSLNRNNSSHLPAEFYVHRSVLPAEALVPEFYIPAFDGYELEALADSSALLELSATLFEEEYFNGWFTADGRLFDLAEEFELLEKDLAGRNLVKSVESFIDRFIQDKVAHDSERIARRLFLIADLMCRSGRERNLVEKTLAVAENLLHPRQAYRKNPFLRQFALESLKITREAVAEGFDLRLQWDWDEDGELWD